MHSSVIEDRRQEQSEVSRENKEKRYDREEGVVSRPLGPYTVAVGLVALMTVIRYLLDPLLGEHHPFVLYLAAAFLASWHRGWQAGALALGLGLLVSDLLFVHPRGALGPLDVEQQVGIIVYGLVGIINVVLIEALRKAKQHSESHAAGLRDEIADHQKTQEALQQARAELQRRVERRTAQLSEANLQLREESTARLEAESSVRRLAALVASSEDAIIGKDLDGTITDWNKGAERLFGYSAEEAIGQHISILTTHDWHGEIARIAESLQRGEDVQPYETVRRTKDGREVPVSVRTSPIKEGGQFVGLSSISRDLSHAKSLEEQLRQAQKMEAIGQLAGGVAHDFNNLLTVISMSGELLLEKLKRGDPARNLVEEIRKAGDRAASLTRQLLTFSRKQLLEIKAVDLNDVAAHAEKMLRRLIGEDVLLTTDLAPDLGNVKADEGQIEQVILNLAINARDAMPRGGKLTIETANIDLDESAATARAGITPGRYVRLRVSDTGTGMDEKTRKRIFEPFFTTKAVGKGTGLGLAVVHGIVKQSGGHIVVSSQPGQGTTFTIYLPVAQGVRVRGKSNQGITEADKGSETVLLVEDEEVLRELTRLSLENSGYSVLVAGHGREALEVAQQHKGQIQLLVSDVVMPEMGGRVLAEHLAASLPGIKVLFLSGYTDDAVVRHGVLEEEMPFLHKPFTPGALARKIREILDQ